MPNQFFSPEGDLEKHFITETWLIDQYLNTELWTWGENGVGELGDNTTVDRSTPVTTFAGGNDWKQVSCGRQVTAAIKTDGTLWTWGNNDSGQLGINLGTLERRTTPVTTFTGGNDWKQVNCFGSHISAIKTDGTLWTWGFNSSGELGDNTTVNRSTPVTTFAGGNDWKQVSCGRQFTAAIKTDGSLWVWGRNDYGKLGINTTTGSLTPVTTFAGGTNWKQVSCGGFNTSAIKTDGTLWIWGGNFLGQLGDNTSVDKYTPVTTFSGGTNWKYVECGYEHMLAIKTNGELWTWGFNAMGQLGDNTAITRSTPVTTFAGGTNWKQIDGDYLTAAIKTDGTLWVWGQNQSAGLGDNTIVNRSTPVTTFAGGNNWRQVSTGFNFIAALKFEYEGR